MRTVFWAAAWILVAGSALGQGAQQAANMQNAPVNMEGDQYYQTALTAARATIENLWMVARKRDSEMKLREMEVERRLLLKDAEAGELRKQLKAVTEERDELKGGASK